jgi:hypothetical protein
MGMGLGLLIKNTIKLLRMPSPMGKIQSAVSDIRCLQEINKIENF